MNSASLVKMANQIGTFFDAMPDRTQARLDVASHIDRNWEPRMIRALIEHCDRTGGDDLLQIVREGLTCLLPNT